MQLSAPLLGTNFSEILIKIQNFSFTKMHLKISSVKWRPFCPGGIWVNAWWVTRCCVYHWVVPLVTDDLKEFVFSEGPRKQKDICQNQRHELMTNLSNAEGGRLNIETPPNQYRDPSVKDETASWPFYLWHGNPHIWKKNGIYIDITMTS